MSATMVRDETALSTEPAFPCGSADVAVCCRGVTKEFGDGSTRIRALQEVDLHVPAGEMSLLIGPSGCGKTTLISIIAGLLEPTAGEVTLFGTPRTSLSDRELIEYRAAQERGEVEDLGHRQSC